MKFADYYLTQIKSLMNVQVLSPSMAFRYGALLLLERCRGGKVSLVE